MNFKKKKFILKILPAEEYGGDRIPVTDYGKLL